MSNVSTSQTRIPLFSGFALFRDLLNINLKDTPKIQKTLQERRWLREIEKKRETLREKLQEDELFPSAQLPFEHGTLFIPSVS